jgi:hypothetical protein
MALPGSEIAPPRRRRAGYGNDRTVLAQAATAAYWGPAARFAAGRAAQPTPGADLLQLVGAEPGLAPGFLFIG